LTAFDGTGMMRGTEPHGDRTVRVKQRQPMTMDELLALPVSVGIKDAARALGVGQSVAYEQAATGMLSGVPVKRLGAGYRVNRADLFRELGLDPAMVRAPEADAKGAA
jgi:hypothetical protein